MPAADIEIFLARLYANEEFLKQFIDSPESTINDNQLSESEKASLFVMDKSDLLMATSSFRHKRNAYKKKG